MRISRQRVHVLIGQGRLTPIKLGEFYFFRPDVKKPPELRRGRPKFRK